MILQERGPLSEVDARVKLLWLLATLVCGLIFVRPASLLIVLGSIAGVAALGGVLRDTVRMMRSLAMIIIVIGLIFGFTVTGEPLFHLIPKVGPIGPAMPLSREGLFIGYISILRIFIFASPLVVILMTTNNSDLIQGLMYLRMPMEFALMIVLALNFVPIVLAEFGRIADAQKARAHSLMEKGFIGKARGLVPIFIPLTLNAVDRADTVGKVLEIRGFARQRFQPEFEPLNARSWWLLAASVALLVLGVGSVVLSQDLIDRAITIL